MAELQATLDELDEFLRTARPASSPAESGSSSGSRRSRTPGQLDRLAREMAHLAQVPPVQYVAVRIVPL